MLWLEEHDDGTKMLLATLHEFLEKEVQPNISEYEQDARSPLKFIKQMGEMEFLGLTIPEQYGGMGMGTVMSSLVARELAYAWPSLHLVWSANASLSAFPIALAGTDEQKSAYLPKLASGEILGCYALTEPDAGSDARNLKLTAKLTKDRKRWVLNGTKTFITNANEASIAVVFARTDRGRHGISAFLVEGEAGLVREGIRVNPIPKWGLPSSVFCEVNFNNVEILKDALLGERGKGFTIAMKTLDGGRINIAAQAIGIASRVLDDALAYVKERPGFGKSVWDNQAVQFNFATWTTELQAAWALVEKVSLAHETDTIPPMFPAQAKLFATITAKRIASEASEYFGAMGYTKELKIMQYVLDVFAAVIYEGASNIQRMVIARGLSK